MHALAAATALALAGTSAQAASLVDLHGQNVAQLNQQYKIASATIGAPTKGSLRHAEMLGLDSDSTLSVINSSTDKDGTQHFRYQQSFRGLPIFGEQVIVSQDKNGNIKNLFGRAVNGLAAEIPAGTPAVAKGRAFDIAKAAALGAHAVAAQIQREKNDLMIFIDDNGHAHKAYVVTFFSDNATKPTRPS